METRWRLHLIDVKLTTASAFSDSLSGPVLHTSRCMPYVEAFSVANEAEEVTLLTASLANMDVRTLHVEQPT